MDDPPALWFCMACLRPAGECELYLALCGHIFCDDHIGADTPASFVCGQCGARGVQIYALSDPLPAEITPYFADADLVVDQTALALKYQLGTLNFLVRHLRAEMAAQAETCRRLHPAAEHGALWKAEIEGLTQANRQLRAENRALMTEVRSLRAQASPPPTARPARPAYTLPEPLPAQKPRPAPISYTETSPIPVMTCPSARPGSSDSSVAVRLQRRLSRARSSRAGAIPRQVATPDSADFAPLPQPRTKRTVLATPFQPRSRLFREPPSPGSTPVSKTRRRGD
ncbi:uncharacterized protein V1510DRAFT_419696 [Dipodascopsis tothii]|uniref:uncharacterized protein n=1 Tax=Dipodascopsis tothii TaxID=44089 RepID=UPI0034CFCD61